MEEEGKRVENGKGRLVVHVMCTDSRGITIAERMGERKVRQKKSTQRSLCTRVNHTNAHASKKVISVHEHTNTTRRICR